MKNTQIRKLLTVLVLGIFCVTTSGCWLIDKINDIINSYYPQEKNISVIVMPPWPLIDEQYQEEEDKIIEAFSNSYSVRDALIDGVGEFNRNSKGTTIRPRYFNDPEDVIEFYNEIDVALNEKKSINEINKGKIRAIRRMANDDPSITCLIYGIYRYSPEQTAISLTLVYYDYVTGITGTETGVVSTTPGNAQEKALQDLMKGLLNKVYE